MPPGMPGHEGVGIVIEKGERVTKVGVNDIVVLTGIGGPPLHAEYVVRKEETVVKIKRRDIPRIQTISQLLSFVSLRNNSRVFIGILLKECISS